MVETPTGTNTPSVVERTRPSPPARRWWRRISSAAPRSSCSARRRCCWCRTRARSGGWRCTRAAFSPPRATACASSPAATTARCSRPTPRARAGRSRPTPSTAGSITSRPGPDGAVAWSAGKQAFVQAGKGEPRTLDVPSTVGGLAFAPKGLRLAIAHYNGVALWFPERAGRARDAGVEGLAPSTSPSVPTAGSSSPRCRSRRCTAGGSSTPSTCG